MGSRGEQLFRVAFSKQRQSIMMTALQKPEKIHSVLRKQISFYMNLRNRARNLMVEDSVMTGQVLSDCGPTDAKWSLLHQKRTERFKYILKKKQRKTVINYFCLIHKCVCSLWVLYGFSQLNRFKSNSANTSVRKYLGDV